MSQGQTNLVDHDGLRNGQNGSGGLNASKRHLDSPEPNQVSALIYCMDNVAKDIHRSFKLDEMKKEYVNSCM